MFLHTKIPRLSLSLTPLIALGLLMDLGERQEGDVPFPSESSSLRLRILAYHIFFCFHHFTDESAWGQYIRTWGRFRQS